jgi:transposase
MEAITERCCGLDVHQAQVTACLLIGAPHQKPCKEIRLFRTVTSELLALRAWLLAAGCTHVGMESTGVYWMPVYAVLEGGFELVVGNAHRIKNVPGRKTDIKDAEWLADLLRHGLIAKSFVPARPLRELRDLLRYRRKLVEAQTAERNRLLKLLEQANIKLASVATNVFGVSGMALLKALLAGEQTPAQIAQLAKGRLRLKLTDLALALEGKLEAHHRFMLTVQLARLEQVAAHIAQIEERVEAKLEPYREQHQRLQQIPGVDWVLAAVLIAEVGTDMSVFGSAARLASWAGVCPGNHESAGKRYSGQTRKGNVFLRTTLVEAGVCAGRSRGTYLSDKFRRLRVRRGAKRAAMAVAHKILIAVYHMLAAGAAYHDHGEAYLDQQNPRRVAASLVRRLERLGYDVTLQARAA